MTTTLDAVPPTVPPPTRQPPTAASLAARFGCRSAVAGEAARALYAVLAEEREPPAAAAFQAWRSLWDELQGPRPRAFAAAISRLATTYRVDPQGLCHERLLFAVHSYYAWVIELAVPQAAAADESRSLFVWPELCGDDEIACVSTKLRDQLAGAIVAGGTGDVFKPLYQSLLPAGTRKALGEFYTPDWLAEHVLDEIEYSGKPQLRLLDPACGSGTFLVAAIRRIRAQQTPSSVESNTELVRRIVDGVVGIDRNPLAVLAARANYLLAIRDLLGEGPVPSIPVYVGDSILGTGLPTQLNNDKFDFVAGNPPWQVWDQLPQAYRAATLPLWQRYGLFSLSANAARHGGGKKDLSMLMLYAAADRYLKTGGKLGFVINQTVFQTQAGSGFRRFQIGAEGPPLKVLRVDDLVEFQPFAGASNWTSTLVLQKGSPTEFPVPYIRWTLRGRRSAIGSETWRSAFDFERCRAAPLDPADPESPWRIEAAQSSARSARHSPPQPSDYAAYLGANTGGANGVYWVRLLERRGDLVLVENLADRGKSTLATQRFEAEVELVYPLLRWRDVGRYRAVPSAHLLLVQDPAARTGMPLAEMHARFPRALAYLQQFQPLLAARAAYRRYQAAGPYWSMYNVGTYTLAPVKVVWRRMDRRLNTAVVTAIEDPLLGWRPIVPQETCVLVDAASLDEAHYLCALLNSAPVDERVRSHSVRGGKGFGTPGMLKYLGLRKFDPSDSSHAELAALSRQAHEASAEKDESSVASLQANIDQSASELLQWSR